MSTTAAQCQLSDNLTEVLKLDWIPEEVKLKICGFVPEWNRHVVFQTKVLKQLKTKQPLLREFLPVVDPHMLEEIEEWKVLEFGYTNQLPALVPSGGLLALLQTKG